MRGWQSNRIALDPDGLPANLEVPKIEQVVTPADHAGIRVQYPLVPLRIATVVLHEADGGLVAAGTRVHRDDGSTAIVGFDGELWLDRYTDGETLQWRRAGRDCAVTLPTLPGETPTRPLGPLACHPRES